MPPADRLLLGALLVAALTVGAKLTLAPRNIYPDRDRMAAAITARLVQAGFAVSQTERLAPYRLRAAKGACRLAVQQVDVEAAERSSFASRTEATGPVRYHYRGGVGTAFPRIRPVLTDQVQRQSARLGLVLAIDPIIAVAASPGCADAAPLLAGLRIHPRAGPAAIRAARP